MRIQTFSILAGSEACNARCPFCISKMTPPLGVDLPEPNVNWRNFKVACRLAKQSGVTTAMFTGKGEPTLFPKQITRYLNEMAEFQFPLIELQTNGILIAEKSAVYKEHLKDWYERGMTTIAVSIVHYDPEKNREVYLPHKKSYIDLPGLIAFLHNTGFSVRLTCILASGFIDNAERTTTLIGFAKKLGVEQLTLTPVNKPDESESFETWKWTNTHHLTGEERVEIIEYLKKHGHKILHLPHGAIVYDVNGQNVCMNNCLSVNPDPEELRNLIFFPDGHLRYYWQYPGSIIL
ncbi:MAG: hypothetical protein A3A28_03895 [Candidatus Sungbacteria bacterium RIFCSPLOWO2_01_FULL_47_32]|uniref:Radical SAM core domain-containing protein n=1 Tax=Candidatus Sungbacteria bacterium RIFCSPHIGHO2_01_FULL_47_32 TaxID=1802264 RepID=A0A1G2K1Y4_9BACT|nr:MAG: hypothetical protein UX72_C0039G0024 [Parcubacteria group bacterium GW2011_GWA2_47_10]OGZ93416.1 MAG: hypothetical protein A2633_01685 [Candidatus Sungbacteria bacterium RIFCSPHIGHO2_01_FULL_47_32]OGZ99833.1 MAG: hypothetical protein A3D57_01230 [Candidatus Sungbacteria bacterium RIFCSPHIGHO2_02_FULL_46_12]OHA05050.1 MAG: hypothetical protein A3A28_03895 [Candidatus Sungbacteria bacterium RIFCSPLOWO2_01_FULL_47_32]